MTTDIERELRDLFREKAGEAPAATPGAAPQHLLRRGRRHQVGTILGSAAVAILVAAGSFAGLRSLLRDSDSFETGRDYDVFERTATIEAFTVTSPSDWFLVNEWPLSTQIPVTSTSGSETCTVDTAGNETCVKGDTTDQIVAPSGGLPMFQLSNVDMGLPAIACEDGLPDGAAVLYIALDGGRATEGIADPSLAPWPAPLGESSPDGRVCGPGRYATFSVSGQPFFAWVGLGAGVTEADRETVLTAYESMVVNDAWKPSQPDEVTPGYVIAGGSTTADGPWRLEVRPGDDVEMALFVHGTSGRIDISLDSDAVSWCCRLKAEPTRAAAVLFGAVHRDATSVFFRRDDGGEDIRATVLPLPPTMPLDLDLFFIEGTAGIEGEVVAIGPDGRHLDGPTSIVTPRGDDVHLQGSLFGHDWETRFTGAFADSTACIHATVDGSGAEPLCPRPIATSLAGDQPSLHVVNTVQLALVVGSVPPDVVGVRFTSDNGSSMLSQFQCQMGPLGWTDPDRKVCALALPPEGSGTFTYLGTTGEVLFEEGMGWGASEPDVVVPMPVDPVHGSTYWAVYLWVGPAGNEEGHRVWEYWYEATAGHVSEGDLACDQGASQALGTDAESRVAAYFDTEEEANTFVLQAGLLGHEAGPVIAHVTTYCLD
jgi:hypothetical protein